MKSRIITIIFLMLFSMLYTNWKARQQTETNKEILELIDTQTEIDSILSNKNISMEKEIDVLLVNQHVILCLLKDPYNLSEECKSNKGE